jgi:tetratricopeptide (TPR) repeat protein
MRSIMLAGLLVLLAWHGEARAEWLEVSSDHFVILADDSERDARRFSEQLERYHSGMALLLDRAVETPSPSNRVTVYVVRNDTMVRKIYGGANKYIGGFYVPRAGGSLAVVPKIDAGNGAADFSMIVLLHEYAHHFLISSSSMSLPRWLSEGAAEFFASSSFSAKGSMMLGRAANHRAGELFYGQDVKAADLLDPTEYDKRPKRDYDAFYGKSWLLYHYLTFEKSRQGQLDRYVGLLKEGKGQREAALSAFGDFGQLEKDLDRYLARRSMMALDLPADQLRVGEIRVRRLTAGEVAIMPVRLRSSRGVTSTEQADALLAEAREVAARYPADASVLAALAETEFDAGNDKEAIAAADAALAIDLAQSNAYVQKGYALFRMAADADDPAAAFQAARKPFVALNRREPDHPLPLIYFYRSYVDAGQTPTPLAVTGLVRASQLAPFDLGLRMTLAQTLLRLDRREEARVALQPVAFSPHGGGLAEVARKLLARMESEPTWKGDGVEAMLAGDADDKNGKDRLAQ